jgi:hypothetical protein
MGPINPELIQQMVARELAKPKPAFEQHIDYSVPSSIPASPMKPETLATMGGIADMLGTYTGLHKPGYGEDNAMLAGHSPAATGLSLLGQLAAQKGITSILRKIGHPAIADAIAANQGAEQLGLGATWGRILHNEPQSLNGYDTYTTALSRGLKQYGR